ncbi:hypothetical protein QFC20_005434 [Naganishia adeliensis]|uniref:Uncharacterized protein n=1 Tax=Naganishia adeliensis TaxID=92952 RepID=A0ACC2VMQ7_9TREE|nr:hypothetical protein QFC20_005434 [Naganishia adeliensis]
MRSILAGGSEPDLRFTDQFEEALRRGVVPAEVKETLQSICSQEALLTLLRNPSVFDGERQLGKKHRRRLALVTEELELQQAAEELERRLADAKAMLEGGANALHRVMQELGLESQPMSFFKTLNWDTRAVKDFEKTVKNAQVYCDKGLLISDDVKKAKEDLKDLQDLLKERRHRWQNIRPKIFHTDTAFWRKLFLPSLASNSAAATIKDASGDCIRTEIGWEDSDWARSSNESSRSTTLGDTSWVPITQRDAKQVRFDPGENIPFTHDVNGFCPDAVSRGPFRRKVRRRIDKSILRKTLQAQAEYVGKAAITEYERVIKSPREICEKGARYLHRVVPQFGVEPPLEAQRSELHIEKTMLEDWMASVREDLARVMRQVIRREKLSITKVLSRSFWTKKSYTLTWMAW